MHDIFRESPIYQMILEEGLQEGREKGLQEGRQEGRQELLQENLQRLRQIITDIVQIRFPELVDLVSQQVTKISDSNLLQHMSIEVATARDAEQTRRILLDQQNA